MDLGTVSTASMIGMGISGLVSIGVPVFLMFYVKFRAKTKINFFFIGAAMYVISAMMLEQICHSLVFGLTKGAIQNNIWLYALYAGAAAAIFEETGRLVAMKYFMNNGKLRIDHAGAFMYGIGHGGAEAILLSGMTCFNNLTTAVMVNSGSMAQTMKTLDAASRKQVEAGVQQLVSTPPVTFYMAGVERVLAIILQIALTILIYQALRQNKKELATLAYLLHFAVDFVTVAAGSFLPILSVECLIAAMTAAVGVTAYFVWQKYEVK